MKNYQNIIFVSAILGGIFGVYFSDFLSIYTIISSGFILLLKAIVVPLVFSSLVSSISHLMSIDVLRKLGSKTIIIFILTTLIASITGLLFGHLIQPGQWFTLGIESAAPIKQALSIKQLLISLIPTNFGAFMLGSNMLFLILIAISVGCSLVIIKRFLSFPVTELFDGLNELMMTITQWVILLSPIGIFGLMAKLTATTGLDSLISLIAYIGTAIIALLIYALIALPFMLKLITKQSAISLGKSVIPSLITGFTTASSSATLPVLMEDLRNKAKVSNKIASFVLPMGVTINMNGTAIFQAIATLFIAQIYSIDLSLMHYGIIIFTTLIASIGAAAIPSAGLITLAMILTTIGIPVEGIGIIFGIDRLIDMVRTTVNLWGNSIATIIIIFWLGEHAYDTN